MHVPLWVWLAFNLIVFAIVTADLYILHRHDHVVSVKRALVESCAWIGLALAFNFGIYIYLGEEQALNFLTGYLIEESLSIDNLFVFIAVFKYFHTPREYQHKVLFWGILGAVIMRAIFIIFGIQLVNAYHWILYLFGAFLIYTGIRMALHNSKETHPEMNRLLTTLTTWMRVTGEYHGSRFWVKIRGKLWATPLFIALLAIELTDLIFAIDSIPAVIAITRDPFIVYTSNIFAVLGLRALYFALAGMMPLFHYLNYGLAAILCFVGFKMLIEPFYTIPIAGSLGFIVLALVSAISASLIFPKNS